MAHAMRAAHRSFVWLDMIFAYIVSSKRIKIIYRRSI